MSDKCPLCAGPIMPNWRWAGRVRRDPRRFLYAIRRDLTLPRNFIVAESYRRFWRGHPLNSAVLEAGQVQDWTRDRSETPCR